METHEETVPAADTDSDVEDEEQSNDSDTRDEGQSQADRVI